MTRPRALARALALAAAAIVGGGVGVDAAKPATRSAALPRLVFSHEKHVSGIGLACTRCHAAALNHRVPAEPVCGACHDQVRAGPTPACDMCHDAPDPEALRPGESLRRGEGFSPDTWACMDASYDHALHAGDGDCAPCHPLAERSTRSEDSLYPRRRLMCAVCHDPDPCTRARPDDPARPSRTSSTETKFNGAHGD